MVLAVIEADDVIDAVIARLLADTGSGGVATLVSNRVYRGSPDSLTPAWPLIIVSSMSSPSLTAADGTHVWANTLTLVKIADKGSDYRNIYTIARRVVSRLDGYADVTQNGVYIHKFRLIETPPQDPEFVSGQRYMYGNQLYRTEAEPA